MDRCQNCGYDLFPTDKVCDRCGTKVPQETPPVVAKKNNKTIQNKAPQKSARSSMKCPSCGASIGNGIKCEYCGASISYNMKREREQLNKAGCPKCGSSNITFNREKQGELRGKKATAIVRSTVGFCKDCGHTWNTATNVDVPKKNNLIWWILGWIFIFPVPLMVLIWRKKCTWSIKTKACVTAGIWVGLLLFYAIVGIAGAVSDSNKTEVETVETVEEVAETDVDNTEVQEMQEAQETSIEDTENVESHIYDNAEIIDLMNGPGTEKVGEISVIKANQADCTDEALLDWYMNYVKNNGNCNYHLIVYNDVDNKGVYANGLKFIQKDIELRFEDGSYMVGDDAGSTYYDIDEDANTITLRFAMADESIVEDIKEKVDAVIPVEYKNSDMYSIDVAGEEGDMDCNLTLVNEAFAGGDCQAIAEEIATKVKELNIGIGYFCIAFQSDDYTLTAISNMDSLSEQEANEISTRAF